MASTVLNIWDPRPKGGGCIGPQEGRHRIAKAQKGRKRLVVKPKQPRLFWDMHMLRVVSSISCSQEEAGLEMAA